ncbi:MAG: 2-oxoacid:acceptor oxidoreductase subunit alpha [Deltaproteobacteria bacterium]|nr:2-oxoacid:acceptor oxidoreductase subunit alpha [Deltaproteobacteria bacterium]MBW2154377.1 2-oxoacid:acceptor oxidoreductase subunit alpha [Deltaproteobacteria bacterium]
MSKNPRLAPGTHFLMGNFALAEGAVAAGCTFVSGYPITPASEIVNRLSVLLPPIGGGFLQTEDEIAAICSAIGASWAGAKSMTATSGPGISLMQENIGFAVATETPLVIADVQRLGPSTGVPSVGLAGDIVQVARGSHGDYQIIALSPESPQDMFDMTIRAFNLAETYRVPVFVMSDAFIGHMREQVVIPDPADIQLVSRKLPQLGTDPMVRRDFQDPNVAPMPVFGHGFKAHVTSSCHNEHGMRNLSDPAVMHDFITKPIEKILKHRDDIVEVVTDYNKGDIVLTAYGSVSRSAKAAALLAREKGLNVGTLRLKTIWPLAQKEIEAAAKVAKRMIVLENNTGQLFPYIKASAASFCPVEFLGPKILGQIHDPEDILKEICT